MIKKLQWNSKFKITQRQVDNIAFSLNWYMNWNAKIRAISKHDFLYSPNAAQATQNNNARMERIQLT